MQHLVVVQLPGELESTITEVAKSELSTERSGQQTAIFTSTIVRRVDRPVY